MFNCLCLAIYVFKTDCFPTEMAFVKLLGLTLDGEEEEAEKNTANRKSI